MVGSYNAYQTELSDRAIALRIHSGLTYKAIAKRLTGAGYLTPRGSELTAEGVFSILKKRLARDARLTMRSEFLLSDISIDLSAFK
jgi:hypothetical protein